MLDAQFRWSEENFEKRLNPPTFHYSSIFVPSYYDHLFITVCTFRGNFIRNY